MSILLPVNTFDSRLRILIPEDFESRMIGFVLSKTQFPFINSEELMSMMFLYGANNGVAETKARSVASLAERTSAELSSSIQKFSSQKPDSESLRAKIVKRQLQLAVDHKDELAIDKIAEDPVMVLDLFAAHVAAYNQEYFFELYGPLKEGELTADIRPRLKSRMVMVCYNRKGNLDIGFGHPMVPVYLWFKDHAGAKP